MAFCKNCGNQVSDGTKFCPKCGQAVDGVPQQQVHQQQGQGYQQPAQGYQQPGQAYQQSAYAYQQPDLGYQQPQQHLVRPNSNMVWAILTTIFCCLPTGIYAIIQASKVDKLYMSGEYDEAIRASKDAKKWSIIGFILAIVVWIIYMIFGGMAFIAALAGAQ